MLGFDTEPVLMRNLDFSSWQGLLSTLVGLALITLIGVGVRLIVMQTLQQRRERENRQINERLRTLIAAYKTLGGSFTGSLVVSPLHLHDLQALGEAAENGVTSTDRARRIRDAVEAALSDIILLGTEEQVRLAAQAASDLVAGRTVRTDELVVSLRHFIRHVLNLDPVPRGLAIPKQGPARNMAARGKGDGGNDGGSKDGGKGGGGMGMGGGAGGGSGGGSGFGVDHRTDDEDAHQG